MSLLLLHMSLQNCHPFFKSEIVVFGHKDLRRLEVPTVHRQMTAKPPL